VSNIIKYETDHGEVQLSADIVRAYLVSGQGNVSSQEVAMFVKLCQFQRLNPFLREAYLIKYSENQPASIVTGKEVFTKRAQKNPRFDGFEAGITVLKNGELLRREGALLLHGEVVLAGWAKVYLKEARVPIFAEASFAEYAGRKGNGDLNKTWSGKPSTMIRKVALVQALREAFPEDLQGLYDASEMGTEQSDLPTQPVHIEPTQPEPVADCEPETGGAFIFNFGKHSGETLASLDSTEDGRGYIVWLSKQDGDKPATCAAIAYLKAQEELVEPEPDDYSDALPVDLANAPEIAF
jgi:phage recombination protein Bet